MNSTKDLDERWQALLRAPYARVFVRDEDGTYGAWVLEFPGCNAGGATVEETMQNLEETMVSWAEGTLEQGGEIPEPWDYLEYSGRVTLRILPSLHERATKLAVLEGVSLNRFLATAIAHYVGYEAREHAIEVGSGRTRRVAEDTTDAESYRAAAPEA